MLLSGKNIFIVEDDTRNRIIFQIMIKRVGANVEFDLWGRQTLERMQKVGKLDLIVLDLMLRYGESGYDIFQQIRQIPEYDAVPIVAVSAADPSTAIPKTREMGFSGFIAKPLNDDLFAEQILQLVNGEHVWYAGDRFEKTK
jgi:CheY-like chemotaxis protein